MTANICPVQKICQYLNIESNKFVADSVAHLMRDVDEAMLVWIAALLGGETSYERRFEHDNPTPLLKYLTAFLIPKEKMKKYTRQLTKEEIRVRERSFLRTKVEITREKEEIKKNNIKYSIQSLLVATVAIRAWLTPSSPATEITDIFPFIMEIKHNAKTLLEVIEEDRKSKGKSRAPVLFKMICPLSLQQRDSPPVTYLLYNASNLLNDRPGYTGGLFRPEVCRAIANELNNRRNAELDVPPTSLLQSGRHVTPLDNGS